MRILITGSRNWDNHRKIEDAILIATVGAFNRREPITIVHGACPTGADNIADALANAHGWVSERHPADWSKGRKAGPLRNQKMVDLGADVCLAFPIRTSFGTRDCMRRAQRAGITVQNWGD